MTLRIERDPNFWRTVTAHPDVRHVLFGMDSDFAFVENDAVMPYAGAHGGFIFLRLEALSRVWELHTAFTPEGWGREAHDLAIEAFNTLPSWQVITTYETRRGQSRPPRSFGFRACGDFEATPFGDWKTWALTRADWESSPAFKRARSCR